VDYAYPSLGFGFTIGPLARDVRDVALVLQTMAGPDYRDVACVESEADDYLGSLDAGVEGLRLAWSDDLGYGAAYAVEESPRVVAAVREAAARYRQLGADVTHTDVTLDDPAPYFWTTFGAVGVGWPLQTPPTFPSPADYRSALEARARTVGRLRGLFERHDLLLCPTVQAVAPPEDLFAERWANVDPSSEAPSSQHYLCLTMMFNWISWPALSVPCGEVDGLPIALQIVGPPCSEVQMLRAAYVFQVLNEQVEAGSRRH
jgi:Asp-tRNA(Asn)/Glu-tRNA(Gln) amidotransferase A subunit family amidase